MKELSIKEVISVSVETYKENWKTLLLISLFSTLVSFTVASMTTFSNTVELLGLRLFLSIASGLIMIISIYYTSRLAVTLIIATKASLLKEDVTIPNAYSKAKEVTWRYIGFSMLFGLMIMIPILLIFFGTFWGEVIKISLPIRAILIVLGIAPAIYLYITFYFSLYTSVIYPDESKIFDYSRKLVKGNFIKVLIILLIPSVVLILVLASDLIFEITQYNVYIQIIFSFIQTIPTMVITPFTVLLALETMGRLELIKESEDESREGIVISKSY